MMEGGGGGGGGGGYPLLQHQAAAPVAKTEYYGGCQVGLGFEQVLNAAVGVDPSTCNLQVLDGGGSLDFGGVSGGFQNNQGNQNIGFDGGSYQFDLDGLGGIHQQQQQQNHGQLQSFESGLITMSDITNYQASGLDWMETGVSNWLSFDNNASFGFPEASPVTPTTSKLSSASSLFNFYGEEETQYQSAIAGDIMDDEDLKSHMVAPPAAVEGVQLLEIGPVQKHEVKKEESEEDDDDDEDEDEDDEEEEEIENQNQVKTPTPTGSKEATPLTPVVKKVFSPRSCSLCPDLVFNTPGKYESHMLTDHHDDHPYPCPTCSKRFAKYYQVQAHEKIHDPDRYKGEPQWLCGHCDKKYHVRVSLYAHYKTSHPGQKPMRQEDIAKFKQKVERKKKASVQVQSPGASITKTLKKNIQQRRKSFTVVVSQLVQEEQTPSPSVIEEPDPLEEEEPPEDENERLDYPSPILLSTPDSRPGHNPCSVCSKVFNLPCQLRDHMYKHTGEKPHKCPHCDESFRLKTFLTAHILRTHPNAANILKMYKCRVCGKDDIMMFNEFYNHRVRKHPEVVYEKEKEKPFACGVCLKPYTLREEAVICAVWAHDPTKLREQMFQHKCPLCPEDLGYFKLSWLRNHWDDEHPDKKPPPMLRKGVNLEESSLKWENLPVVKVAKEKAQEIRENGLPKEISFDYSWYFDLTEFGPSPKETHWMATLMLETLEKKRGTAGGEDPHVCTICGEELSKRGNFRRHLNQVHIQKDMITEEETRRIAEAKKKKDQEEVDNGKYVVVNGKKKKVKVVYMTDSEDEAREAGKDKQKEPNIFKCQFCSKTFPKKRALQFHEVRGHINPKPTRETPKSSRGRKEGRNGMRRSRLMEFEEEEELEGHGKRSRSRSVNINDREAIKAVLGNKMVQVVVPRVLPTELPMEYKEVKTEPKEESGQLPGVKVEWEEERGDEVEVKVEGGGGRGKRRLSRRAVVPRRKLLLQTVAVNNLKKKMRMNRAKNNIKVEDKLEQEELTSEEDIKQEMGMPVVVVQRKEKEESVKLKASLKLEQVTRMLNFVKRS